MMHAKGNVQQVLQLQDPTTPQYWRKIIESSEAGAGLPCNIHFQRMLHILHGHGQKTCSFLSKFCQIAFELLGHSQRFM